jgi:hypothetical protein
VTTAMASIHEARNGHLECLTDGSGTYWCEHIQDMLTAGEDAKSIWANSTLGGLRLQVPYVPTLNQWATVELGAEHFGNYEVYLLPFLDKYGDEKETKELLGYFSPGEGRQVLRNMIHAWFQPQMYRADKIGQCIMTGHSYASQVLWKEDIDQASTDSRRVAQLWSVYTTGFCLPCRGVADYATGDDLVPDPSRNLPRGWR